MKAPVLWITFFGVILVSSSLFFKISAFIPNSFIVRKFNGKTYGDVINKLDTFMTPSTVILYFEIPINFMQLMWLTFGPKIHALKRLKWLPYCCMCVFFIVNEELSLLTDMCIMQGYYVYALGALSIAYIFLIASMGIFHKTIKWNIVSDSKNTKYFCFTVSLAISLKLSYQTYILNAILMSACRYFFKKNINESAILTVSLYSVMTIVLLVLEILRSYYLHGYWFYGLFAPQIFLSLFALSKHFYQLNDDKNILIIVVLIISILTQIGHILYAVLRKKRAGYKLLSIMHLQNLNNEIEQTDIEADLNPYQHLKMLNEENDNFDNEHYGYNNFYDDDDCDLLLRKKSRINYEANE